MAATEEMLIAGSAVILAELGTVDMGPMFDVKAFAGAVYEAMRALEPNAPTAKAAISLKLDTSEFEATVAHFSAVVAEFKAIIESASAEDGEPSRG